MSTGKYLYTWSAKTQKEEFFLIRALCCDLTFQEDVSRYKGGITFL